MDIEAGSLVFSNAGRDKKDLFLVLEVCGEYCFIADGRRRKAEKPKKKKIKHLTDTGKTAATLKSKLDSGEKPTNTEIRKSLKGYAEQIGC